MVAGLFVLDKLIERHPQGGIILDPEIKGRLDGVIADFALSLRSLAARNALPIASGGLRQAG